MKDLITMSPEELGNHIRECEKILQSKREERFRHLVDEVVNAMKKLKDEFPCTILVTDLYCENCEEDIDVQIDIEDLICKDNYRNY